MRAGLTSGGINTPNDAHPDNFALLSTMVGTNKTNQQKMGDLNCMHVPSSINDDIYSGRLSLADNKAQYKSIIANGCSKRIIKTSRNLFDE